MKRYKGVVVFTYYKEVEVEAEDKDQAHSLSMTPLSVATHTERVRFKTLQKLKERQHESKSNLYRRSLERRQPSV